MRLIVGLGNPGKAYENTRHNIGFMLIDRLAGAYNIGCGQTDGNACWGRGLIAGEEVILLKPQTYMNLSGTVVLEFVVSMSIPAGSVIAAYDDCDLPLGRLRLRRGGGSGGHKGVESIIRCLKTADFPRLRLGIGRPSDFSLQSKADLKDYVLTPFTRGELDVMDDMLARGVASVETLIGKGIEYAMNRFNPSD